MPSAYFDLLVRELGGPLGDVLRKGTGRHLGDFSPQITIEQQLVQLDNLNRTQPPGWGLRMGSLFDAHAHGPVGFAMLSAPDLNAALDVVRKYGHVRTPFLVFEVRRNARETTLLTYTKGLVPSQRVPVLESTAVSLHNMAVALTGARDAIRTCFDYPAPAWSSLYKRFLPPVAFDAYENAMTVPAEVASSRSPLADEAVHAAALATLADVAAPASGPAARLIAQIEHLLAVAAGRLTLEDAAMSLHLSPRTLERNLRAAGTTFRDVADKSRRVRAEALLADADVALAQVGYAVGYSDSGNFGRACRRWFGMGPRDYRRLLLTDAQQDR